ncbi:MAG: hypothetical protein N2556_01170 [Anaerolineae bacterium]|nr:hypothetical protein [Anaerolineae bacterium]
MEARFGNHLDCLLPLPEFRFLLQEDVDTEGVEAGVGDRFVGKGAWLGMEGVSSQQKYGVGLFDGVFLASPLKSRIARGKCARSKYARSKYARGKYARGRKAKGGILSENFTTKVIKDTQRTQRGI